MTAGERCVRQVCVGDRRVCVCARFRCTSSRRKPSEHWPFIGRKYARRLRAAPLARSSTWRSRGSKSHIETVWPFSSRRDSKLQIVDWPPLPRRERRDHRCDVESLGDGRHPRHRRRQRHRRLAGHLTDRREQCGPCGGRASASSDCRRASQRPPATAGDRARPPATRRRQPTADANLRVR